MNAEKSATGVKKKLKDLGRRLNARGRGTAEWHEDWLIQEIHQTGEADKVRPLTFYYPYPR